MYTRTPNYMRIQTSVYRSPYSHRNWVKMTGVRGAHIQNNQPTNRIKARVKRAQRTLSERKKNRNLVKQKIHRCTKFDEMWRALIYRMIFTLLQQTTLKSIQKMVHRRNIYFSYFRTNSICWWDAMCLLCYAGCACVYVCCANFCVCCRPCS